MKDGPLKFTVVPKQDGTLAHHLEVGSLPDNFFFSSAMGPFLGGD